MSTFIEERKNKCVQVLPLKNKNIKIVKIPSCKQLLWTVSFFSLLCS